MQQSNKTMEEFVIYIKSLEQRIAALEAKIAQLENQIAEQETQIAEQENQIAELQENQCEVELVMPEEETPTEPETLEPLAELEPLDQLETLEKLEKLDQLETLDQLEKLETLNQLEPLVEPGTPEIPEIPAEPAQPEPAPAAPAAAKYGTPVDDIRKAISLGDRFLFQRELFAQNGELMQKTLDAINGCQSFDEAVSYIDSKFGWDKESSTYQLFLTPIHRRFA